MDNMEFTNDKDEIIFIIFFLIKIELLLNELLK